MPQIAWVVFDGSYLHIGCLYQGIAYGGRECIAILLVIFCEVLRRFF